MYLQSECDKLRSVLELKAETTVDTALQAQQAATTPDGPIAEVPEPGQAPVRAKKMAVSAEPTGADRATLVHHDKNAG